MKNTFIFIQICILIMGCKPQNQQLPILGNPIKQGNSTIYPAIPPFRFTNQDSIEVTERTFEGKIYIANFIFLNCPTICPRMTKELLKVYNTFHTNPNILYISHTIDPERDTVTNLKRYANSLKADSHKWFFVTGKKSYIYHIAEKAYFMTAYADKEAPGGYVHSGGLLLIDKNRHIRGVYDGTNAEETERLKQDIQILLSEQF